MTDANALISLIREHGHEIRVEFGVARLGVFGSRVRGEAGPRATSTCWWSPSLTLP